MKKNDLVYICSPLSAPTKEGIRKNMEKAAYYAGLVSGVTGCRAIAPTASFRNIWMITSRRSGK